MTDKDKKEIQKRAKKIFKIAKWLLPIFIAEHKDELGDKQGLQLALLCTLCDRKVDLHKQVFRGLIGRMPKDKLVEKAGFATEKVIRLYERNYVRGFDEAEYSSFESEDIENKQYGGGIFAGIFCISGSNFPPDLDQKFVIILSLLAGEIDFVRAGYIDVKTKEKQQYWINLRKNPQK